MRRYTRGSPLGSTWVREHAAGEERVAELPLPQPQRSPGKARRCCPAARYFLGWTKRPRAAGGARVAAGPRREGAHRNCKNAMSIATVSTSNPPPALQPRAGCGFGGSGHAAATNPSNTPPAAAQATSSRRGEGGSAVTHGPCWKAAGTMTYARVTRGKVPGVALSKMDTAGQAALERGAPAAELPSGSGRSPIVAAALSVLRRNCPLGFRIAASCAGRGRGERGSGASWLLRQPRPATSAHHPPTRQGPAGRSSLMAAPPPPGGK